MRIFVFFAFIWLCAVGDISPANAAVRCNSEDLLINPQSAKMRERLPIRGERLKVVKRSMDAVLGKPIFEAIGTGDIDRNEMGWLDELAQNQSELASELHIEAFYDSRKQLHLTMLGTEGLNDVFHGKNKAGWSSPFLFEPVDGEISNELKLKLWHERKHPRSRKGYEFFHDFAVHWSLGIFPENMVALIDQRLLALDQILQNRGLKRVSRFPEIENVIKEARNALISGDLDVSSATISKLFAMPASGPSDFIRALAISFQSTTASSLSGEIERLELNKQDAQAVQLAIKQAYQAYPEPTQLQLKKCTTSLLSNAKQLGWKPHSNK